MPNTTGSPHMWQLYLFKNFRVRVMQQWRDPFGVPFVRIETADEGEAVAEGLPEADFLAEARPISC